MVTLASAGPCARALERHADAVDAVAGALRLVHRGRATAPWSTRPPAAALVLRHELADAESHPQHHHQQS